jgi:hypothetical protein
MNSGEKWSDPYKLTTSAQIKNYTNQIYNLMSVQ